MEEKKIDRNVVGRRWDEDEEEMQIERVCDACSWRLLLPLMLTATLVSFVHGNEQREMRE
jgi:hypothetical protein